MVSLTRGALSVSMFVSAISSNACLLLVSVVCSDVAALQSVRSLDCLPDTNLGAGRWIGQAALVMQNRAAMSDHHVEEEADPEIITLLPT